MNGMKILSSLSHIHEKYINEVETSQIPKMKKWGLCGIVIAACLAVALGVYTQADEHTVSFDLTDRIVVSETAMSGKQMVNIEGTIVKVLEGGLSFELDNGMTIIVEDFTKIGVDSQTEVRKEMQLVEPTFREGNQISGYAENLDASEITAYQIYTNWNWENPIK